MDKPSVRPERPWFASGPTAKRPGWTSGALPHALLGRGIRAPEVVERFAHGLRLTRSVLEVVCVSTTSALAHRHLQDVAHRVEQWHGDAQLLDFHIEMLG